MTARTGAVLLLLSAGVGGILIGGLGYRYFGNQRTRSAPEVAVAVIPDAQSAQSTQQVPRQRKPRFLHYTNGRYGFSVIVPVNFEVGPEPQDGNGLMFRSRDGSCVLTVSGANTGDGLTTAQHFAADRDMLENDAASELVYQHLTLGWFVLSSRNTHNNKIQYTKQFVGSRSINTFMFIYGAEQRREYDPILIAMVQSFRPGDLTRTW